MSGTLSILSNQSSRIFKVSKATDNPCSGSAWVQHALKNGKHFRFRSLGKSWTELVSNGVEIDGRLRITPSLTEMLHDDIGQGRIQFEAAQQIGEDRVKFRPFLKVGHALQMQSFQISDLREKIA